MNRTPNTPANGGQILTEEGAFALAVKCGRADTADFRITGTSKSHKVAIAVLESSDALKLVQTIEADLRAALSIPANAPVTSGQIPKWHERMEAHYASGNVQALSTEYFKDLEIADLRAALAAPAIPTVDRNSILQEVLEEFDCYSPYDISEREVVERIRAMKSVDPAPVSGMPDLAARLNEIDRHLVKCRFTERHAARQLVYSMLHDVCGTPSPQAPDTTNPTGETK